jgi:methyl-accepting chemotaxis protein/methyl-accepting chemotaxis protein-1 (serine sensor receptor)
MLVRVLINLVVSGAVLWAVFRIAAALRQLAIEVGKRAEEIAAATSQVSSSSHFLAQGSSEQAATLEQTSASSEEINAMPTKTARTRGAPPIW